MRQEGGRLENAQVLGASRVEFCMMACVPLIPLLPNYSKLVTDTGSGKALHERQSCDESDRL